MEAKVYEIEGNETDVLNVETWPDIETANAVTETDTFKTHTRNFIEHFIGNDTWILLER